MGRDEHGRRGAVTTEVVTPPDSTRGCRGVKKAMREQRQRDREVALRPQTHERLSPPELARESRRNSMGSFQGANRLTDDAITVRL